MTATAEDLIKKLAHGGRIVSSNDLSTYQIAVAQAGCAGMSFWVDDRSFGYAYLPPDTTTVKAETYFLSQDQSSHWYVVPKSREDEWSAWCNLSEDDEAAWDAPEWAAPVGGAPSLVTFTGFTVG